LIPFKTIQRPESQKKWFVWYTKPRAEKKVLERLVSNNFDAYLPLKKELRQWSDRKKYVETPLFNGYIFINSTTKSKDIIKITEGILGPLTFEGKLASVPNNIINGLKELENEQNPWELVSKRFLRGTKVKIVSGPFIGENAVVVQNKGVKKIAVLIEVLGKSCLLHLEEDNIQLDK
jgi:transcription antitermination factor NusG